MRPNSAARSPGSRQQQSAKTLGKTTVPKGGQAGGSSKSSGYRSASLKTFDYKSNLKAPADKRSSLPVTVDAPFVVQT